MKHWMGLALAGLLSVPAAACPLTDSLAQRYGISFSGFEKPIPASPEPKVMADRAYVRVMLQDKAAVSDGYRHAVLLDVAGKRAWILRTGGFVPVYQWYGPVEVGDVSAADCRNELPGGLRLESIPAPDAAMKKGAGGPLDARSARPAVAAQAVGGT